MIRLLLPLILALTGCTHQPQVYNPHGDSEDPPLRIEVSDASLIAGDFRLVGRVKDAEHNWPVPASVGLGRWGERFLADSTGSFVFEASGVNQRDTVVVYHPGWAILMEQVAALVADP